MADSNTETQIHLGRSGRKFKLHPPSPCYQIPPKQKSPIPTQTLDQIINLPQSDLALIQQIHIPPRDARAWHVPAGTICRLTVIEGSQVADVNVWNLHNPREHFYSAKNRQLHASHLTTGDSLWSCMPWIRPIATIVADSIAYGIDRDNAGVHDVIGSRCDPYTHCVMTGQSLHTSCHSNLTRAVLPFGLTERDVHDVFNVFMCTGFMPRTGQYFAKPSPAVKGDFLDFFAHIDLLVAAGACRQGDVSIPCGSDAEPKCYPLRAEVFRLPQHVLRDWTAPTPSQYKGGHGLVYRDAQPDMA